MIKLFAVVTLVCAFFVGPVVFAEVNIDEELSIGEENPDVKSTIQSENINTDQFVDERPNYDDQQILVENTIDITLPYKQRRQKWGALFSVGLEKYNPKNFVSVIQDKSFEELTGSKPVNMVAVELGVKYNFSLGSFAVLGGVAQGQISNDSQMLTEIKVQTLKLDANYALDNVFNEPYIVPYGQVGLHKTAWTETSVSGGNEISEDLNSNISYHIKAGLLFQLNWIENWFDPNTVREGLRTSGLQNTYIDIFVIHYNTEAKGTEDVNVPDSGGVADLSSTEIGAGLKLEF